MSTLQAAQQAGLTGGRNDMTHINPETGYDVGDVCGRGGCAGIIEQHEAEGGCSCHISPPCGYCTTPKEYCPECEWDAELEVMLIDREDAAQWKAYRESAEGKWQMGHKPHQFDPTRINWHSRGHTHFSMKKIGVAPASMSRSELEEGLRGTFGGRFERWREAGSHTWFEYIAYTD